MLLPQIPDGGMEHWNGNGLLTLTDLVLRIFQFTHCEGEKYCSYNYQLISISHLTPLGSRRAIAEWLLVQIIRVKQRRRKIIVVWLVTCQSISPSHSYKRQGAGRQAATARIPRQLWQYPGRRWVPQFYVTKSIIPTNKIQKTRS